MRRAAAPRMGMDPNLRRFRLVFVALFCALFALACSKRDAAPASPAPAVAAKSNPVAVGRSLVVTEDLRVTVADVDAASSRVRAEVLRVGGFVADANASGKDEDRVARLVLRVPVDKLADVRAALGGAGEITSDNEKVEDVTDERVDLKARLRNARVQEQRIVEIMTSKAGTIAETIDAERELARVRETIERLEAQERSLDGRVELATVHVTLSAPPLVAWHSPGKSIASAASAGMRAAAAFFTYAAMTLAACLPTLAPLFAVGFAIAFFVRRRRRAAMTELG
jgi:hypothetical protein